MAKTFDNRDVSYNKGKAFNLSQKQLKKAGAAKAAAKRTVSISDTKRATSGANKGKTLGPGGKPLTGSVKLPSGVTAVYKDGKRVTTATAAKAAPSTRSVSRPGSSGSGGSGGSSAKGAAARRADNAGVKDGTIREGANGKGARRYNAKTGRWDKVNQAGLGGTAKISAAPSSSSNAMVDKWNALSPAQKRNYSNNMQTWMKAAGLNPARVAANMAGGKGGVLSGAAGMMSPGKPKPKGAFTPGAVEANRPKPGPGLKKGDTKNFMSGPAVWDGKKWVKKK